MSDGGIWQVTGGKTTNGVVVRVGKDTKSQEHPDGRLATGSIVAQVDLDDDRLRYTLLSGEGPKDGWVSLTFKDNKLMTRAGEKGTKAAKEEAEVKKARESYGTEGARRVWFMPQGTRGDVQPMVALGVGLRKKGVEVRILASGNFKKFVEAYGLQFTAQGVDCKAKMEEQNEENKTLTADSDISKKYKEDPGKAGGDQLDKWFKDEAFLKDGIKVMMKLLETEKPDIIFTHGLNQCIPFYIWKKYDVPVCGLEYYPSMGDGPELMTSRFDDLVEMSKKVAPEFGFDAFEGTEVEDFIHWRMSRNYCAVDGTFIDSFTDESWDEERKALQKKCKELCTGFLVMDPALQMTDASQFGGLDGLKRVQDYLDAGSPPIYLGWGSMPLPTNFMAKFILSFKMNKMRAIICAGWGGHTLEGLKEFVKLNIPEDPMGLVEYAEKELLFVSVAPHEWLFQRCSCTIHHGGAGTTCAALRGGVPTIITPFAVDQFAYADWVTKLGCGQKLDLMENPEKFMDPKWSKVLRVATTDATMIAKAKEIGKELCARDTVKEMTKGVLELIEESRSRPPDEKRRFGR